MQHRRLQRRHSSRANSAIFGVAFNPVTSKWSAFRETTLEVTIHFVDGRPGRPAASAVRANRLVNTRVGAAATDQPPAVGAPTRKNILRERLLVLCRIPSPFGSSRRHAMQCLKVELFDSLRCHKLHGLPQRSPPRRGNRSSVPSNRGAHTSLASASIVTEALELATEMMCADTGFHAD
jgi:hypothetical protein